MKSVIFILVMLPFQLTGMVAALICLALAAGWELGRDLASWAVGK